MFGGEAGFVAESQEGGEVKIGFPFCINDVAGVVAVVVVIFSSY